MSPMQQHAESPRQRLVVIGNGMAGARMVEEVLARPGGDDFEVVMFGDEPYGNYNRILLSGVLAGSHHPQDIFINPMRWYEEHGVTLHAGVRVSGIDVEGHVVHGENGVSERYDRLVIATGSTPFIPPMAGLDIASGGRKPGIFVFRTLDDCESMLAYAGAGGARTAGVIGGGLLGLEAARGLQAQGLEVHVVHLMPWLMETQLDATAGGVLRQTLEGMGVQIHLETLTTEVLGDEHVTGLRFKDDSTLDCDMLVIAAGIRPNAALAREAGLTVERGIVVEDDLSVRGQTDVFAIGECAQHRGLVYGLVAPLWEQARVLADRLTGANADAAYGGSQLSTKLKVMGVDLAVMGINSPAEGDEVVTYVEACSGIYKKLIVREGRLVGAMLLGDASSAPTLLHLFDQGGPLPARRAELLFPLASSSIEASVGDLPDSAQICACNGVSKGRLASAVEGGARSFKMLCDVTRAGTGCGSCKPQVQSILEWAAGGLVTEEPSVHYYVPGVPLTKPALIAAIQLQQLRSVSAVFEALAGGLEDAGSKVGLASLLKTLWGAEYEDERDARFINDRVHANIQNDGTFSVIPRIYGGVTSAEQLRKIADVADKYQVPMVKITGGQRIDLLGIEKEQLPLVWQDLGMPSGHAYTKAFRTCKTCVGTEFCRYGLGDSTTLGIEIEQRFQGIESPHKMKLATAGCPRNCSEATTKDLGVVAIGDGRWEIYVGGAAGSRVRKGDVLCVVDSHIEVLNYMGRFMQYYREHAKYLERTYDFVERIGIDRLRALLIDDVEHICAQLDTDMQSAVDAYVDPWQEAGAPVHPAQFERVLEPVSEALNA